MAYPHKWSPSSYKSSAGQRKLIGQRPMLYRWTTQPTWVQRRTQNAWIGINGESTSMVWPTLGSTTAEERNRTGANPEGLVGARCGVWSGGCPSHRGGVWGAGYALSRKNDFFFHLKRRGLVVKFVKRDEIWGGDKFALASSTPNSGSPPFPRDLPPRVQRIFLPQRCSPTT